MGFFLAALGILVAGGLAAFLLGRSPRACTAVGAGSGVAAGILGLIAAVPALQGRESSFRMSWDVPYGSFALGLDALSAIFLVPLFVLSILASVYGAEYLHAYRDKKQLGAPWLFTNLLVAGIALVVSARNGVLFLVAWEVMSLAAFFLVTFEDEREDVRQAGWTYLVATHLGTAFLLALFLGLGRGHESLDFDTFRAPASAGALFLLAVVGFGTKAGFLPFHVWLPEAHPAAPSHVSALLSGVMIKTGVYGLLRTLTFLGPPPAWWGWLLAGVGLASAIFGILFALAQRDLKRLLAYSSVENIGIITLAAGLGLLGVTHGRPALAALAFAGALFHVWNHALMKGLLFLSAGAVLHATGTRELDRLGGLLKKMPVTGLCFLIGAVAISGLPPLNGFAGEFLIYLGALRGGSVLPALAAIGGLALVGGLAAACFAKAFGIVFLGEPRTGLADPAHDPGWAMKGPIAVLALSCVAVGFLSPILVGVLRPAVRTLGPGLEGLGVGGTLGPVIAVAAVLVLFVAALTLLRWELLRRRSVGATGTWDCGYAKPAARMQYTSSSFSQPLTDLFALAVRTHKRFTPPEGFFPRVSSLATETPDACREYLFRPAFTGIVWALGRLRWLQTGRVHLYVLYVALTLLVLLAWKLG